MATHSIVHSGGFSFPLLGVRVRISPIVVPASLAGMQAKVCVDMPHAIEGTLLKLYGYGSSSEHITEVEFRVQTDDGEVHMIKRAYNPTDLASVAVVTPEE